MMIDKITLEKVSREKIFSVIQRVLSGEGYSRDELASLTDMSAVTVGKITGVMLKAGYFSSEEQFSPRRRSPEIIFPSETLNALILELSDDLLSATLANLRGSVLFKDSRPRNYSLPFEDDISAFADSVYERVRDILSASETTVAVLTDKDGAKLLKYATSPMIREERIYKKDSCVTNYFRATYPSECVVLLSLNDRMTVRIFDRGEEVNPSANAFLTPESLGEESAIRYIADYLEPLFNILRPSRVLLSSEKLGITPAFSSKLRAEIARRMRTEKENAPEVDGGGELGLVPGAALGQIRNDISMIFAGIDRL